MINLLRSGENLKRIFVDNWVGGKLLWLLRERGMSDNYAQGQGDD